MQLTICNIFVKNMQNKLEFYPQMPQIQPYTSFYFSYWSIVTTDISKLFAVSKL